MSWWMSNNGVECHAVGCGVRVHASRLMCSRHWRLVPGELRRAIADSRGDERDDAELDAIEHVKGVCT